MAAKLADHRLPSWFLEHCVKLWDELNDAAVLLNVCDTESEDAQNQSRYSSVEIYQVESALFETICNVVRPHSSRARAASPGPAGRDNVPPISFTNDALVLHFPGESYRTLGSRFLQCTVEHFARTIGADLILLTIDTIEGLVRHFSAGHDGDRNLGIGQLIDVYFHDTESYELSQQDMHSLFQEELGSDTVKSIDPESSEGIGGPLNVPDSKYFDSKMILAAPQVKKTTKLYNGSHLRNKPLVICLPDISKFYRHQNYENVLKSLRDASSKRGECTRNTILIATEAASHEESSWRSETSWDKRLLSLLGSKPASKAISIVPVNSYTQKSLLRQDEHFIDPSVAGRNHCQNVTALRHALQRSSQPDALSLHEMNIDWKLLDKAQAGTFLESRLLSAEEIEEMVRECGDQFDGAKIGSIISRVGRREEIISNWKSGRVTVHDQSTEDLDSNPEWSCFPDKIRDTIAKIRGDEDKYKWESQLIDLIIDPSNISDGWDSIAIDNDIEEGIKQIIHRPDGTTGSRPNYGILKKTRINGALLYGPPGTGKTHLARVLARESHAVTICASAAAIENLFIGETEKAIKGLFNLARMLAPSIIFIDEADSLFQDRRAQGAWGRGRTNQLLAEMDGLSKSKDSAFVLLATNFPQDLDDAVLRRVPSRFLIGLPSTVLRKKIFGIMLNEEILDPGIDIDELAFRTPRFSGSDIASLCTQAAIICEGNSDFFDSGEHKGRRKLDQSHFDQAFKRVSPTVSYRALSLVKEFAEEFDPAGFRKILATEETEQANPSNVFKNPWQPQMPETAGATSSTFPENSAGVSSPVPVLPHIDCRVVEVDSESDRSNPEAFRYDRLDVIPGVNQIRVLSINKVDDAEQRLLSCTLKTVDLNDLTPEYRLMKTNSSKLLEEASWIKECYKSANYNADALSTNLWTQQWTDETFTMPNFHRDIPSETALTAIPDRFTWGDYMALSYVWGDTSIQKSILLNGTPFQVGLNLYRALSRLRSSFELKSRKLWIWIDAICINQESLDERQNQVHKMGTIYLQALCVRGWMGQPLAAVAASIPAVQALLRTLSEDLDMVQPWSRMTLQPEISQQIWLVTTNLLNEPYWERLWIMQEMALAPSLAFWYGEYTLTPIDVMRLHRLQLLASRVVTSLFSVRRHQDIVTELQKASKIIGRIIALRGYRNIGEEMLPAYEEFSRIYSIASIMAAPTLIEPNLIHLIQSSKATDPRDKVYGALGLLREQISSRIEPEYGPNVRAEDVYLKFSRLCIEEAGLGLIAKMVNYKLKDSLSPTPLPLPSWALNLNEEASIGTFETQIRSMLFYDKIYDAAKGMNASIGFSEDGRILVCQGLLVDSIDGLGRGAEALRWDMSKGMNLKSTLQDTEQTMYTQRSNSSLADFETSKLSVARALLHDAEFQFSSGPSPLSFPWSLAEDLSRRPRYHPEQYGGENDEEVPLAASLDKSLGFIRNFFELFVYGNQEFKMGGRPLRSYFNCEDSHCRDPEAYANMTVSLMPYFTSRRLFTSGKGRVGTVPLNARPGDRIVLLSGSDMPVVLRAKGDKYELVGVCFADGLMKGEAVRDTGDSQAELQLFHIC